MAWRKALLLLTTRCGVGAKRSLSDGGDAGTNAVTSMLGIDDTILRANRIARLLDDDAPLGRAVAPDGPIDRLLRPGGVVAFDNALAGGRVADPSRDDASTAAIRDLNDQVRQDERLVPVLFPVGDGLLTAVKRG